VEEIDASELLGEGRGANLNRGGRVGRRKRGGVEWDRGSMKRVGV
jgi:hypothetical protein